MNFLIPDDIPDKKLTDNEIVKALECCVIDQNCSKCPHYNNGKIQTLECLETSIKEALDIINRQKAEKEALIAGQETLQKYIAEQKTEIERLTNQKYRVFIPARGCGKTEFVRGQFRDLKAEAIKEFAERLNKEAEKVEIDREGDFVETGNKIYDTVANWCKATSDNLVKEMVGDA